MGKKEINLNFDADAPLLEVEDLKMYFHTEDGVVRAVNGVSYKLEAGKTIGIVGESGSGKSVTAMTLMGLIDMPPGKIEGGSVRYKGVSLLEASEKDLRKIRGNKIAMIFQDPMTSLNPVYKIGHQLAEPLRVHKGMKKKEAWARAVELLRLVGIPSPEQRVKEYPHQFSGGMRQRAMIAMALACDPDILIADEPTTALDVTIQAQIIQLMQELQKKSNSAIVMITHDLGVVADIADDVLVMYAGRPVEYGSIEDVFYKPSHPYTWGLMGSLPKSISDSGAREEKIELLPIEGMPPSLIDLPSGCAFHPRCPYAKEICQEQDPLMKELGDDSGKRHAARCHFAGDSEFTKENMESIAFAQRGGDA
jgi:oligopeptide transport system ATP-binding protein